MTNTGDPHPVRIYCLLSFSSRPFFFLHLLNLRLYLIKTHHRSKISLAGATFINSRMPGSVYPKGGSPFESIFPYSPILSIILIHLQTPTLLALYYTSRTIQVYLHGHGRFFRNLALVGESGHEKWSTEKGFNCLVRQIQSRLANIVAESQQETENMVRFRKDIAELKALRWFLVGTECETFFGKLDNETPEPTNKENPPRTYYPKLMSRHLWNLLNRLPAGTYLTTLVVDGTGVETEYFKMVLEKMEASLRGVSAKNCRNLECYLWAEWISEAMYENRPIALQTLRVCCSFCALVV
jgi:hypothetical protein